MSGIPVLDFRIRVSENFCNDFPKELPLPLSVEPIDPQTLTELRACTEALEDRKAIDLRILDVRGKSSITDFLVICSGTSSPHLRALCTSAEKALFNSPGKVSRHRDEFESGWVVTDGIDFVVHIFTEEMRELFRLEALWKDAPEIDPSGI